MPSALSTRALLLGGPFLFCLITAQIGGWGGWVLFGLILLLLLWMPFMILATGGAMKHALPAFLPLSAGIAGFAVGSFLPTFLGLPRDFV